MALLQHLPRPHPNRSCFTRSFCYAAAAVTLLCAGHPFWAPALTPERPPATSASEVPRPLNRHARRALTSILNDVWAPSPSPDPAPGTKPAAPAATADPTATATDPPNLPASSQAATAPAHDGPGGRFAHTGSAKLPTPAPLPHHPLPPNPTPPNTRSQTPSCLAIPTRPPHLPQAPAQFA